MVRLENFTMYTKDRAAAALISCKVQGNVVRLLTVLLEGTWLTLGHLTWNMISAVLPACFARGFGLEVAPYAVLCDPNQNEIEVAIEKRNGRFLLQMAGRS
ncbi:uncharacterized protein [Medicago truncatula]|uniref:uncharacterized protein n=1 Tax=Medicago truncatula TaxID=3880 RepID=UPI000D2F2E13|nr:uncharacterized protein LOC25500797 [Medicago truncatula]